MGKLILLFVAVPIIETVLLVRIGAAIGWGGTLLLVLVTGVVGGWLARLQGLRAWRAWRDAVAAGQVPQEGALEALLLLLGGVLLITPGVLTDAVGLLLLVSPVRRAVAAALRARLAPTWAEQATVVVGSAPGSEVRVVRSDPGAGFGLGWGPPVGRGARPGEGEGDGAMRRPAQQIIDADFEVSGEER